MDSSFLGQLPDIVHDFQLETEDISKDSVVHIINGVHGQRRQVWRWDETLGGGPGSAVRLQTCIEGDAEPKLRAVKCLLLNNTAALIRYRRELETLAKFSQRKYSGFFVICFGWFQSPDWLHVSLEYIPHGDLQKYVEKHKRLPDREASKVAWQISRALRYMHTAGFAHRDLSPKNILICACPPSPWWVKLGDFGLSKRVVTDDEPSYLMGTEDYVAPEILLQDREVVESATNWFAGDMWSLGQVASYILVGKVAVQGRVRVYKYFQGQLKFPHEALRAAGASLEAVEFIAAAMCIDVQSRLTVETALQHAWLRSEARQLTLQAEDNQSLQCSSLNSEVATSWSDGWEESSEANASWTGPIPKSEHSQSRPTTAIQDVLLAEHPASALHANPFRDSSTSLAMASGEEQEAEENGSTYGKYWKSNARQTSRLLARAESFSRGDADALDRLELARLPRRVDIITGLAVSSNATQLAIVYYDAGGDGGASSTSRQNATSTIKPTARDGSSIEAESVSATGPSSRASAGLQLWTIDPPMCIADVWLPPRSCLQRLLFNPANTWIAGSIGNDIYTFELLDGGSSGLKYGDVIRNKTRVTSLDVDPESGYLIAVTVDGVARMWDVLARHPPGLSFEAVERYLFKGVLWCSPMMSLLTALWCDGYRTRVMTQSADCKLHVWNVFGSPQHVLECQRKHNEPYRWGEVTIFADWKTIYHVALSPRRRCAAVAHKDGVSLLRQGRKGGWTHHCPRGDGVIMLTTKRKIYTMRYIPASVLLLIAFAEGPVELWNSLTGHRVIELANGRAQFLSPAPKEDSLNMALFLDRTWPMVWNLSSLLEAENVQSHLGSPHFIANSPDGHWAVSVPFSILTPTPIFFWNLQESKIKYIKENPSDKAILCARYAEDSARVVYLSAALLVLTWQFEVESLGETSQSLYRDPVIAVRRRRATAAARGDDDDVDDDDDDDDDDESRIIIEPIHEWEGGPADISLDLNLVTVADVYDGKCGLHVWDVDTGRHKWFLGWHPLFAPESERRVLARLPDADLVDLAFSSDSKLLAARVGPAIIIFSMDTSTQLLRLDVYPEFSNGPCYPSPSENSSQGYIKDGFHIQYHKPDRPFRSSNQGSELAVQAMDRLYFASPAHHASNDQGMLALIRRNGSVLAWDLRRWLPIHLSFLPSGADVLSSALSPDGSMLAVALDGGRVNVYNPQEYTILREFTVPHSSRLYHLSISIDSTTLIALFSTCYLVWHVGTPCRTGRLERSREREVIELGAKSAFVSFANMSAIVSTDDGFVRIWSLENGRLLQEYQGSC